MQKSNIDISKMSTYQGTKTIKAVPTTRKDYCEYRGWELPNDEDPDEKTYLVEYPVDPLSKPNHPNHEGYISMSPAHVFEKAYKPAETWLDRLIIERDELSDRLEALDVALKENLVPDSQVEVLTQQSAIMRRYLDILNVRVENAN